MPNHLILSALTRDFHHLTDCGAVLARVERRRTGRPRERQLFTRVCGGGGRGARNGARGRRTRARSIREACGHTPEVRDLTLLASSGPRWWVVDRTLPTDRVDALAVDQHGCVIVILRLRVYMCCIIWCVL